MTLEFKGSVKIIEEYLRKDFDSFLSLKLEVTKYSYNFKIEVDANMFVGDQLFHGDMNIYFNKLISSTPVLDYSFKSKSMNLEFYLISPIDKIEADINLI